MAIASTEELVLAELAGSVDERSSVDEPHSLQDITDALSLSSHRLSDRIELASTLETLREDGWIAENAPDDAGLGDDRVAFELTGVGRERADEIRKRLAATDVEVVDGTRRTLPLADAASVLRLSLVEIAADATDEGTYYVRDVPDDATIVGRTAALERCEGELERVRDAGGRAVFVTGPPGIGKTTLVDAVLERTDDAVAVRRARCRASAAEPYQPLRDALADVEATPFVDVGPAVEDVDAYRAQQTALFGDVTDALLGPATDASAAEATDTSPRVLFLDDLHQADAATLEYLEYLFERLPEVPLAVVASYRPEAALDDADGVPDETPAATPVTRLELPPFDRGETRELIERLLEHRGVPEAFVEAVHDRTGGNPLFVEETVATLRETNQLDPDLEVYPERAAAIDAPAAIRETIDGRVERFPEPARDLMRWASLLGEGFSAADLGAVAELSATEFRTYLESFVDGAIFDRDEDGTVRFRSGVVRDACRAEIPDAERKRRHARIADHLCDREPTSEADDGRELAGTIAVHFERADDPESAIEWYRRAADLATDDYAQEFAIDRYHDALGLAREIDDESAISEIATELAKIYFTVGEYDEAERHVRFARDRGGDDPERHRTTMLAAKIAVERGDFDRALELVEDGLASVEDVPSPAACKLLGAKSDVLRARNDYAGARKLAERNHEMADQLDAPELRAGALHDIGTAALVQADYDEARSNLERSLEISRRLDDRHGATKALTNLGIVAYRQGRYDEARDAYERSLERYREVGNRHGVAKSRNNLGLVAYRQGRYGEAREYYQQARETFEAVRDRNNGALALMNIGNVAYGQRRYDEARDAYERALERFREIGDCNQVALAWNNLGMVAREQGRYGIAREHLERSIDAKRDFDDRNSEAVSRRELGRVAIEQGRYEEADDHLQWALDVHRAVDADRETAICRLALGRLAFERGDVGTASGRGEEALETLTDLDATDDALEALELLVECALEAGDDERGLARCRRALELLGDREEPTDADDRREWFERQRARLEDSSET